MDWGGLDGSGRMPDLYSRHGPFDHQMVDDPGKLPEKLEDSFQPYLVGEPEEGKRELLRESESILHRFFHSSIYQELQSKINFFREQKSRLHRKSVSRSVVTETNVNKNPEYENLKCRLKQLINENQSLVSQIGKRGDILRKSVRNSDRVN